MWRKLFGVLLLVLLAPSFCFSGELDLMDWAMTAPRDQVAATLSEAVKLLETEWELSRRAAERLRSLDESLTRAESALRVSSASYETALAKKDLEINRLTKAARQNRIKNALYGFAVGAVVGGAFSAVVFR